MYYYLLFAVDWLLFLLRLSDRNPPKTMHTNLNLIDYMVTALRIFSSRAIFIWLGVYPQMSCGLCVSGLVKFGHCSGDISFERKTLLIIFCSPKKQHIRSLNQEMFYECYFISKDSNPRMILRGEKFILAHMVPELKEYTEDLIIPQPSVWQMCVHLLSYLGVSLWCLWCPNIFSVK